MQHGVEEIGGAIAARLNARGIFSSESSRSMDKSGLVRFHIAAAEEFQRIVDEVGPSATKLFGCTLFDFKKSSDSGSRADELELKRINLRDIDLSNFTETVRKRACFCRFTGVVVCGKLCVQAFKTAGVHTVLEDESESGAAVIVLIDNSVLSTATGAEVMAKFPVGMKLAIREPVFRQLWKDGTIGINITNPADIVTLDDSRVSGSVVTEEFLQEQGVIGSSDAFRVLGNSHFVHKEWKKAAEAYKISAEVLVAYTLNVPVRNQGRRPFEIPTIDASILKERLTTVYSNMCEALLRLGSYKKALSVAEKCLEVSPSHERSLLQMAKSLHEMQRYEEAIACLQLLQSLESRVTTDRSILDRVKGAEIAARQSRSGIYHFAEFLEVSEQKKEAPSCAQFLGPIEIRVGSDREHGRRGMFATRDLKAGELLLVSKALVLGSTKKAQAKSGAKFCFTWSQQPQPAAGCTTGLLQVGFIDALQQDMIVKAIARALDSAQFANQVYSLQGGEATSDIPPVTLYTENWDDNKYVERGVDVCRIRDTMLINMFDDALFGLASFFNHSCVPNCKSSVYGESLFISSTREVRCGEELTITYLKLCHTVLFRKARMRVRYIPFECDCPRCKFEEKAYENTPALGDLARRFNEALELKSGADSPAWRTNLSRRMVRECAEIAGKLENILKSIDCAFFSLKEKDWIRCSFSAAYMPAYFDKARDTKLHLAVDEIMRVVASVDAGSEGLVAFAAAGFDGRLGFIGGKKGPAYFLHLLKKYSANIYLPTKDRDFRTLLDWSRTCAPGGISVDDLGSFSFSF